jgi:hypothetical protein
MIQPTAYTYRVEIYTTSLLISGSYEVTPYQRLSDALNNDLSPFIVLRDAIISPINHPEQVQPVSQMLVDRSHMPIMTTLREPTPPPDYTPPAMAGRFEVHQMMFFTPAFVVRANYYKRPDMGLQQALENTTDMFIPIKIVHIFPIAGGSPIVREFACIGRNHINALYPSAASDDARAPGDESSPW